MIFLSLGRFPKRSLTNQKTHSKTKVVSFLFYVLVSSSQTNSYDGYVVRLDLVMNDVFILNVNMFMWGKLQKWYSKCNWKGWCVWARWHWLSHCLKSYKILNSCVFIFWNVYNMWCSLQWNIVDLNDHLLAN